ncbi:ester cyclase [bacterium]|nr:ester cyclase [bacterium]
MMKHCLISISAAALLGFGCSTIPPSNPHESLLEANKQVVRTSHEEIWSKGRFDLIADLYTENFVCHFVIGPEWQGQDGFLAEVKSHRTSFPDWREEIQRMVAENDYVVSHFRSAGTHLGDFHGLARTGRKVSIDEIAIYRLKDGKIAEQWGLPDIHGMNVQLGIVKSDGPTSENQAVP